jgi:predicted transcriptional regulator
VVTTGIYLKSNHLRLATLSGSKRDHEIIDAKFNKLSFPKDDNFEQVNMLKKTIIAFIKKNNVEKIAINGRARSGQRQGGADSFKIHGFLLAIIEYPISTIFSATIRATNTKVIELKTKRPPTKDLGVAYDLAFELLPNA